ncbi:MAG: hypothetical protein ACREPW_02785, partial [Candidatus Binataceae bacterium]
MARKPSFEPGRKIVVVHAVRPQMWRRLITHLRFAAETEHNLRDAPHLNLLRALGNSIAPMVPI